MNPWIIAYLIGSALALLLLIVLVLSQSSTISSMKECMSNMRDRCACTEGRVNKIECAVDWFLERKGLKIEHSNTSWRWTVMPIQQGHELDDWWKQIQRHREEIVYALYEASKNALEDHDKEKNKKGKKKK